MAVHSDNLAQVIFTRPTQQWRSQEFHLGGIRFN